MSIKFLKLYYCNFKAIAVSSRFNTSPAAILTKSNKNLKAIFVSINICFSILQEMAWILENLCNVPYVRVEIHFP